MKFLLYFLLFMFLMQASNGIIINEIMYNPSSEQGGDGNSEWVELYNNGTEIINVSGWNFCGKNLLKGYINNLDKKLYRNLTYIIPVKGYALVTDGGSTETCGTKVYDNFDVNLNATALHVDAASICSGLTNSGKTVSLYNSNNMLVAEVNYENIAEEGYSIEFVNGSWKPSSILGGTPGYKNSISNETIPEEKTKNIILETYLDEIIYINTEYTKLFKIKIENKDNCSVKDTISVSYNITNPLFIKQDKFTKEVGCSSYASTGEFTPEIPGNYTLCGTIINSTINETDFSDNSACLDFQVVETSGIPCNIKINITTNKTFVYEAGQSIKFYNNLNNEAFPFVIEYWIEDFFGNIYKSKYNTTNTNQKSWKTNIAEQDRVLFIKSKIYPNCNDSNLSDNYAEKMFIVKSGPDESIDSSEESVLEIIEVDDEVKFGGTADVKVSIYKGNTNKYSISLWVEDNGDKISETTKIHLYDKYSSYNGQLPVQLDSNCNEKLKDGKYDVVIEGLDKEDKKEIKIEGIETSACATSASSSASSAGSEKSSTKKFNFEVKDFNENIEAGKKFSTKIVLDNNNDQDMPIKLWSYVYRGSKSYSGDREENMKEFVLKANSQHIVELENIVENAEPGNYKFKVLVNKNNQKTNTEITEDVVINEIIKSEKIDVASEKDKESAGTETKTQISNDALIGNYGLVYESTTEKAKKLIPFFIIILSILINVVLILRR